MLDFFAQVDTITLQEQLNNASAQQDEYLSIVKGLQEQILALMPVIIVSIAAIIIVYIISAINRMRVDKAILRIDKNLQKLVTERSKSSDTNVEHSDVQISDPKNEGEHNPPKDWFA